MVDRNPARRSRLTWSMVAAGFVAYCVSCGGLALLLARDVSASLGWLVPSEITMIVTTVGVSFGAGLALGHSKVLVVAADHLRG